MSKPEINTASAPNLNEAQALAVRSGRGVLVSRAGEINAATGASLNAALSGPGLVLVHAPFVARRLGMPLRGRIFDLAELFAFVRPARFATPTAQGLAAFLGEGSAPTVEDEAVLVHKLTDRLLGDMKVFEGAERESAIGAARHMMKAPWIWGPSAIEALGADLAGGKPARYVPWHDLPEWEERPPRPAPSSHPVDGTEARAALDRLLARALDPAARETRDAQASYAETAAGIFAPRQRENEPNLVLAEAGTGIGKTLGYLAPSAVWARRNQGAVWISTYTKNLQRQISQTLSRVQSDDASSRLRTIIRKGRENYLCLLNYEELSAAPFQAVAAGLVGRWIEKTADGDMVGGDFPAWLVPLLGQGHARDAQAIGLTDRRGECIYGACAHYRRCFIEQMRVKTEDAEIIVANHAVLLTRAAGDAGLPSRFARAPLERLVLDEGHHLFDAADDAFSSHLTARELGELRRFLRGPEQQRTRGRARALLERVGDLLPDDVEAQNLLHRMMRLAHTLPTGQWRRQLNEGLDGAGYRFLSALEAQVLARAASSVRDEHGLECPAAPVSEDVAQSAAKFAESLAALRVCLKDIAARLNQRLDDDADELDTPTRGRIEAVIRSVVLRGEGLLPAWISMLESLHEGTPAGFVDWFASGRSPDGDVGMHRHALDPTRPLSEHLYRPAHGVFVTSATLFDGEESRDITGASHLEAPAVRTRLSSPFPYADRSRFIVARDVDTRELEQLAAAMRVLFHAAGGGGLGIFTAISRLRAVYRKIKTPLEGLGIPLYAQHVDEIDAGTLVDIFRSESNSCLLGTDAVREGIDVSGQSLRLIVLERVPWPRPDILHKARAEHFGGRAYEEEIARRRITQAFGRLIRRGDDKGVFVILGAQVPSRLLSGIPGGVEIERTGLAETSRRIAEFLA